MFKLRREFVGTKELVTLEKIKLPKELEWVEIIKRIKERRPHAKFLFYYGKRVSEKPEFVFDTRNGMVPLVPDKIEVYDLAEEGMVKRYKLVNTIRFSPAWVDPDVDTSMLLWDILNSL